MSVVNFLVTGSSVGGLRNGPSSVCSLLERSMDWAEILFLIVIAMTFATTGIAARQLFRIRKDRVL